MANVRDTAKEQAAGHYGPPAERKMSLDDLKRRLRESLAGEDTTAFTAPVAENDRVAGDRLA